MSITICLLDSCLPNSGVFVQLSQSPVSLCWLTAQKYTPLSSGSSFSTVKVPVRASFFVAGNLSSLKLLSYIWLLNAVVKTICFTASPGSCLYQYICRYELPLVWLQFIVADWPSAFHSSGVWVTLLPSVRPVWAKTKSHLVVQVTCLYHENWIAKITES